MGSHSTALLAGLLLMNFSVDHVWSSLSHTFAMMTPVTALGTMLVLAMGILVKFDWWDISNGLEKSVLA